MIGFMMKLRIQSSKTLKMNSLTQEEAAPVRDQARKAS